MKNLLFFLWLLLFPVADSLGSFLDRKSGRQKEKEDSDTEGWSAMFLLVFYFLVAWILYLKQ